MWPMLLMLGGSGMQIAGSMYGASQSLKQSKYQQDILKYQADYQKAATEINVARVRKETARTMSSQKAATAASGFQSSDAMEQMIDTELQGDIDIALLRQAGGIENLRLQNAGTMARAQGYGVAAGLYQRGFGTLLNTGTMLGSRAGWFESSTGGTKVPYIPAK